MFGLKFSKKSPKTQAPVTARARAPRPEMFNRHGSPNFPSYSAYKLAVLQWQRANKR